MFSLSGYFAHDNFLIADGPTYIQHDAVVTVDQFTNVEDFVLSDSPEKRQFFFKSTL